MRPLPASWPTKARTSPARILPSQRNSQLRHGRSHIQPRRSKRCKASSPKPDRSSSPAQHYSPVLRASSRRQRSSALTGKFLRSRPSTVSPDCLMWPPAAKSAPPWASQIVSGEDGQGVVGFQPGRQHSRRQQYPTASGYGMWRLTRPSSRYRDIRGRYCRGVQSGRRHSRRRAVPTAPGYRDVAESPATSRSRTELQRRLLPQRSVRTAAFSP